MTGPAITIESLPGFTGLPVFCYSGASQAVRPFLDRLLVELNRRRLLGLILAARPACRTIAARLCECDLLFVNQPGLPCRPDQAADPWRLTWAVEKVSSISECADLLVARLDALCRLAPVWGCVLIGGKSSRMGRPKHLLPERSGGTWLERTVEILAPQLAGLVLSGAGAVPASLAAIHRLPDLPDVRGPCAGLLSAARWMPLVSWLVVACDMPFVSAAAVNWLLSERRPGCWACLPRLEEGQRGEPLLAWYDFRALALLEEQVWQGNWRIGSLASHPRITTPLVPEGLQRSWANINTPDELQRLFPQN